MKTKYFTDNANIKNNQDFVLIEKLSSGSHFYLISDGMGAYEKGDIASKFVSENIFEFLNQQNDYDEFIIQKAVNRATSFLKQLNNKENIKSGATIGGIILDSMSAHVFWVGDVFIGIIRDYKILFKNKMHTMINVLLDSGTDLSPSEMNRYKHIVSRSVSGDISKSQVGYEKIDLIEVDQIIICSDGVYNTISIEEFLLKGLTLKELETYLSEYGEDNYSLIQISDIENHS